MTNTATSARDEAMAQADAVADLLWKESHEACVRLICEELGFAGEFTTDLVDKYMEDLAPGVTTHERRAQGPAMARYARMGLIRPTEKYIESDQETCHARPKRVWKVQTFSV